uniref:Uncharacterized protein n=1 Tax=Panagrolaimus superbus TaxID=310955 RepID=A0A914YID4_9BILA
MDSELSKDEKNQLAADLIIGFLVAEDDADDDTDSDKEVIEEVTVTEPLEEYVENISKESSVESQISEILNIGEKIHFQNRKENITAAQMMSSTSKESTAKLFRSHSVPKCYPKRRKKTNPICVVTKTNSPPK